MKIKFISSVICIFYFMLFGCQTIKNNDNYKETLEIPLELTLYSTLLDTINTQNEIPESKVRSPNSINLNDSSITSFIYYKFEEKKGELSVEKESTYKPQMVHTIDLFKRQIEYLENQKIHLLSNEELISIFNKKNKKVNGAHITIEGLSNGLSQVLELTNSKKIPVVLFINSMDFEDSNETLQVDELKKFKHLTLGIRNVRNISDIKREKTWFETKNIKQPVSISYASSQVSLNETELKKMGIKLAFNHLSGVIDKNSNQYYLPRFPLNNIFGQLNGIINNGFEVRTYALPLKIKVIESKTEGSRLTQILEIDKSVSDTRKLNCYINNEPVSKLSRQAQFPIKFSAMKNWGHRIEINFPKVEKQSHLLRCSLLEDMNTSSNTPRFRWGTIYLDNLSIN